MAESEERAAFDLSDVADNRCPDGRYSARGVVPTQTRAHPLRHTFAHNYLEQYPGDVAGLAKLLGHSSLDITRIYSQPTVEHLSARVEQLRQNAYGD